MLYNIFVNQKALIELTPQINLQEAVLLNYLINICGSKSPKIAEKRLDGFTWIDYGKILKDLPLLGLETTTSLIGKIKNLEGYGYIKTFNERFNTGIRKYFEITEKCDLLTFSIENTHSISENQELPKDNFRNLPVGSSGTSKNEVNNSISNDSISSNKYLSLSLLLKQYITTNNPKEIVKDSQIRKWADDFRLMIEKDGRTEEEIKAVLEWCQSDSFWKNNILSAGKFREKFGRLHGAMLQKKPHKESLLDRERKDTYVVKKEPIVK
jgi:hypothetical protein